MGSATVRVTLRRKDELCPTLGPSIVICHVSASTSSFSSSATQACASMASVPPSLNGQCPSCNRWFDNDTSVLRHMNHPWSSCATWLEFLESISPPTQHSSPTHTSRDDNTSNNDSTTYNDDTTHHNDTTHNDETMLDSDAIDDLDIAHYEDIHPNVPQVFGSGAGFIDVFKSDHNAEKRRDNIYYPFSSKGEWGLASWLSRSGLSMRATDDFLSLPIVRTKSCTTYHLLIEHQGPAIVTFLHNRKNAPQPLGGPS